MNFVFVNEEEIVVWIITGVWIGGNTNLTGPFKMCNGSLVTREIRGSYPAELLHNPSLMILAFKLPIKIKFILPRSYQHQIGFFHSLAASPCICTVGKEQRFEPRTGEQGLLPIDWRILIIITSCKLEYSHIFSLEIPIKILVSSCKINVIYSVDWIIVDI